MNFLKLFLPSEDASARARAIWRQWIGISMIFMLMFSWWALGAFGVVPVLGGGFARAEAVQELRTDAVERSILEYRIRHCNATTADGRTFLFELLQKQLKLYEDITGQVYPLPTCADLAGLS